MNNIKTRIDTLENKNPNDAQLEDARKSYKNWQADLEKFQADLLKAQAAVQKAKEVRVGAEKIRDDLLRQLQQIEEPPKGP